MYTIRRNLIFLFICLFVSGCSVKAQSSYNPQLASAQIDAALNDAVKTGEGQISRNAVVWVSAPEQGFQYAGAAGLARADGDDPMTTQHQYNIASVGKVFTATVVHQLAEEGELGLRGIDTPLLELDVFPPEVIDELLLIDGKPYGRQITIRHLLTHTSGMRCVYFDDETSPSSLLPGTTDVAAPNSLIGTVVFHPQLGLAQRTECFLNGQPAGCDPQDFLLSKDWSHWDYQAWLADPQDRMAGLINFYLAGMNEYGLWPPGEGFHYSDTNYIILGLLVEQITGDTLHNQIGRRIFEPLGMDDTFYHTDLPIDHYDPNMADAWAWDVPLVSSQVNMSFDWAGGGEFSTLHDLDKFVRALTDGELFQENGTLDTMFQVPQDVRGLSYTSGMIVFPSENGPILLMMGSNGSWVDYHTATGLMVIGSVDDFDGMQRAIMLRNQVYSALANNGISSIPVSKTSATLGLMLSLVVLLGSLVITGIGALGAKRKGGKLPKPLKQITWMVVLSMVVNAVMFVIIYNTVDQNPVQLMFGFGMEVHRLVKITSLALLGLAAVTCWFAVQLWRQEDIALSRRIGYSLVAAASIVYAWSWWAMF